MDLYMEARMTVIWVNIMITTSTNSKQDNIFDCCQGLQFERETASRWRSVRRSPWGLLVLSPTTKDDTESHLTHCIVT